MIDKCTCDNNPEKYYSFEMLECQQKDGAKPYIWDTNKEFCLDKCDKTNKNFFPSDTLFNDCVSVVKKKLPPKLEKLINTINFASKFINRFNPIANYLFTKYNNDYSQFIIVGFARLCVDFSVDEQFINLEKVKVLNSAINSDLATLLNLFALILFNIFILKIDAVHIEKIDDIKTNIDIESFNLFNDYTLINAVFDIGCSAGNLSMYFDKLCTTFDLIDYSKLKYDEALKLSVDKMLDSVTFFNILTQSIRSAHDYLNVNISKYPNCDNYDGKLRLGSETITNHVGGRYQSDYMLFYITHLLFYKDYQPMINYILNRSVNNFDNKLILLYERCLANLIAKAKADDENQKLILEQKKKNFLDMQKRLKQNGGCSLYNEYISLKHDYLHLKKLYK